MRLIDAEKFEVFDATCQITKGIRSGKTVDIFSMVNGAGSLRVELAQKSSNGQNCRSPNPRR